MERLSEKRLVAILQLVGCEKLCLSCYLGPIKSWLPESLVCELVEEVCCSPWVCSIKNAVGLNKLFESRWNFRFLTSAQPKEWTWWTDGGFSRLHVWQRLGYGSPKKVWEAGLERLAHETAVTAVVFTTCGVAEGWKNAREGNQLRATCKLLGASKTMGRCKILDDTKQTATGQRRSYCYLYDILLNVRTNMYELFWNPYGQQEKDQGIVT